MEEEIREETTECTSSELMESNSIKETIQSTCEMVCSQFIRLTDICYNVMIKPD